MMDDRRARILEAAIRGFIDTGEPVSSGWLFENFDFGIKPAMIRLELDELEEEGYLKKPHYSAGRVPTNRGYEFFARRLLERENGGNGDAGLARQRAVRGGARDVRNARGMNDPRDVRDTRNLQNFLDELSEELGLLSVAADRARDMVYKAGLEALVERLDWENREELRSVIRDFTSVDENIDKYLPEAADNKGEGLQVFIGKKSPVTKSDTLAVVCGTYKVNGATVSIFAIGPKRMDYEKVIKVFRNLS